MYTCLCLTAGIMTGEIHFTLYTCSYDVNNICQISKQSILNCGTSCTIRNLTQDTKN